MGCDLIASGFVLLYNDLPVYSGTGAGGVAAAISKRINTNPRGPACACCIRVIMKKCDYLYN